MFVQTTNRIMISEATQTTTAQQIVNAQRNYFNTGVTKTYSFRLEQLKKLKAAFEKYEREFVEALYTDLRKPEQEAYTTEYTVTYAEIEATIKNLRTWMEPDHVPTPLFFVPGKSRIHSDPYGVTLVISPWNYPIKNLFSPVLGAIAAGNTVILKPSELAPASSHLTKKVIAEFFAPEYITVFEGGPQETTQLLEQKFDYIMFTGGTEIGRIIYQAAAKNLTPVTLELGGKSPCIIDSYTDLETTVKRLVWGKFTNAGQTCIAPDYVYVQNDIKDRFLQETKKCLIEFFGNNPEESKDFGRIITPKHFNRIKNLIDGDIYFGGQTNEADKFIAPTIINNASWNDKVMQEEIFGPVMPVIGYNTVEEVINTINAGNKPLALYVFTKSPAFADKIIDNTSSGAVVVNDVLVHAGHPHLPFGGVGASGTGAYNGKLSFDTFSHKKAVLHRSFLLDVKQRYAPYNAKNLNFLKFAIRKLLN